MISSRVWLTWYCNICLCSTASEQARIRSASRPAFAALPIATVATGTPFGICIQQLAETSRRELALQQGLRSVVSISLAALQEELSRVKHVLPYVFCVHQTCYFVYAP